MILKLRIYGLEVLLAERLGYQLLAVVVHQVLGRLLGLYMNQTDQGYSMANALKFVDLTIALCPLS